MMTREERRRYVRKYLRLVVLILILVAFLTAFMFFSHYKSAMSQASGANINFDPSILSDLSEEDVRINHFDAIDASLNRPVFMSTRRPPVLTEDAEDPEDPVASVEPLLATLNSIIITGDINVILIQDGSLTVRLEEGMAHKGWVLERILKEAVIFRSGDQTQRLELRQFAQTVPKKTVILGEGNEKEK